jgi:hypothetical protein
MAKREALNVGKVDVTVGLERGANSSSTINPPLAGATAGGADGMALVLHGEEVGPSEGSFVQPHPTDPCKALFMVNDTTESPSLVLVINDTKLLKLLYQV